MDPAHTDPGAPSIPPTNAIELPGANHPGGGEEKPVTKLLSELNDLKLSQSPRGETWAEIIAGGASRFCSVDSPEFTDLAVQRYYAAHADSPHPVVVKSAIAILREESKRCGEVRDVFLRVGKKDKTSLFDLADGTGKVVIITASGYEITMYPHVAFCRPPGMRAQVTPIPYNEADPEFAAHLLQVQLGLTLKQTKLLVMWIVAALAGQGPYPVLHLIGPPGSGKSTIALMIREIVDPCEGGILSRPKEAADLFRAAAGMHVVVLDNVSSLPQALSDVMCQIATGTGVRRKKNYDDEAVVIQSLRRPQILASLTDVGLSSDFRDRRVVIELPSRVDQGHRPEAELLAESREALPHILGGLFKGLSHALGNLETSSHRRLPRMADFARLAAAAAPAFGWDPEEWLEVYRENVGDQLNDVLDSDPLGRALAGIVREHGGLRITSARLLAMLRQLHPAIAPRNAIALGKKITKLELALRREGVRLRREFSPDRRRERILLFDLIGDEPDAGTSAQEDNDEDDVSPAANTATDLESDSSSLRVEESPPHFMMPGFEPDDPPPGVLLNGEVPAGRWVADGEDVVWEPL